MNRIFTAAIAAAAIALAGATPTRATTFPSLTTIYIASGVVDSTPTPAEGVATVINCTNMSGQTASVRFQFRAGNGAPSAGATLLLPSLASRTVTTQGGVDFFSATPLPTGPLFGGAVQVLSTQSAIYCSAMIMDATADTSPSGIALHMVRFNPHPGTVE